jgi:hypothetical protein
MKEAYLGLLPGLPLRSRDLTSAAAPASAWRTLACF